MLHLNYLPNGRYQIHFQGIRDAHRVVLDPAITDAQAQAVQSLVESLSASVRNNLPLPEATAVWLAGVRGTLRDRLQEAGLCGPMELTTLGELTTWIMTRTNWAASTRRMYETAVDYLETVWGKPRILRTLTEQDGKEIERYANSQGLGFNTIMVRLRACKTILQEACNRGWIDDNPMAGVKITQVANTERLFWVSPELTERVLGVLDPRYRVIVALARYGGLRCPSEVMALRWADVDFERDRMLVPQPKTAHQGRSVRTVPLFAELRPHLESWRKESKPDAEWVIPHWSRQGVDFRAGLAQKLRRHGITPWPKLFQNMRSTRETELADKYPPHVVCAWIGNSQPVAAKHYLQVTGKHFADATGSSPQGQPVLPVTIAGSEAGTSPAPEPESRIPPPCCQSSPAIPLSGEVPPSPSPLCPTVP